MGNQSPERSRRPRPRNRARRFLRQWDKVWISPWPDGEKLSWYEAAHYAYTQGRSLPARLDVRLREFSIRRGGRDAGDGLKKLKAVESLGGLSIDSSPTKEVLLRAEQVRERKPHRPDYGAQPW